MSRTKKELVDLYNRGELKEEERNYGASLADSAYGGVVIVKIEYGIVDKVFGYTFFNNSKGEAVKNFFYRKIFYADRDYFIMDGVHYYINDFIKCGV